MKKKLSEWFSYIEGLHPQAIALGLDRVKAVSIRLGILSFACPVVIVGGTNGKGSCVAFLESILSQAGYSVGTYTSPHLLRFNERIRIVGEEVNDFLLFAAFTQVERARGSIELTYFEFTTLAALLLFQQANLDAVILEVGLGGRLDAVNSVEPDVSIITSIDLDHVEWLGSTREAIGYEKAGILRPYKPAVCGDVNPPKSVLETAKQLGSRLYCVQQDFNFEIEKESCAWSWKSKQTHYNHLPMPSLPVQNAATALMAIECLQPLLKVTETAVSSGLRKAFLPGRYQTKFISKIQFILDVAHNAAAAAYLAKQLIDHPVSGYTHAVVSILSDKDGVEILRPLIPIVKNWYLAGLDVPRGSSVEMIANYLHKLGVNAYYIYRSESILSTLQQAIGESKAEDRIVVFGSFYVVGPVLRYLQQFQRKET